MATLVEIVEFGCASAALHGAPRSGDRAVYARYDGGALIAMIDGLGHGELAAAASDEAARVLEADPSAEVDELVRRCHLALRKTRGATMTLAHVAASGAMTWLGVGNVEAMLLRAPNAGGDETIASRGGAVGFNLPPLNPRTLPLAFGDTIVLATDGIRRGFRDEVQLARSAADIAHGILAHHATGRDDACVAVARFVAAGRLA